MGIASRYNLDSGLLLSFWDPFFSFSEVTRINGIGEWGEWPQMRRTLLCIRGDSLLVGRRKLVKRFVKGGWGGGVLRKEKERRRDKKVKVLDHPNLRAALPCLRTIDIHSDGGREEAKSDPKNIDLREKERIRKQNRAGKKSSRMRKEDSDFTCCKIFFQTKKISPGEEG